MQTWKGLVIEGTARSGVGKSAGLCSHVICSGTRLFQGEDGPERLPGCVVTHRSKQQQALYIQLQTFFLISQSVENSQFQFQWQPGWPHPLSQKTTLVTALALLSICIWKHVCLQFP